MKGRPRRDGETHDGLATEAGAARPKGQRHPLDGAGAQQTTHLIGVAGEHHCLWDQQEVGSIVVARSLGQVRAG